MIGQTLSHYRVLERLGSGGMGVVYKAHDTKLDRHVALKLIPPELTRDAATRERFVQEARAASALDHPNICTIYEIDTTPEGQMFIAMALYDGGTLKRSIDDGPLPAAEALAIATQIAEGLAEAHEAGIVHRDIKPANVMLTKHRLVKVVDFGVAKLLGVTGLTQTGSTLGTLAYMSPEQLDGAEVDQQSDIWSLGAVLYELLTGAPPFTAESQWAVMNAIGNHDPEPPSAVAKGISPELDRLVMRSLEKTKDKRFGSARELLRVATACNEASRPGVPSSLTTPRSNRRGLLVAAAATVLLVTSAVAWAWSSVNGSRWAREEALPEIARLVDEEGAFSAAFALAEEAERVIPGDPFLADLWDDVSAPVSIETLPSGADVYFRGFVDQDGDWIPLGQTPLVDVRLPRGLFQWRIERVGYAPLIMTAHNPGGMLGNYPGLENPLSPGRRVELLPAADLPEDMLYVPAGSESLPLSGFGFDLVPLGSFLIDKYEVTNEQFKEFVDSGGYERPEYWEGLEFIMDGQELSWETAIAQFTDRTGRPGPATWELADYPDGQASYPVGGVSWYEAAAYAVFRDKSLPTVYHWARAAHTDGSQPFVIASSNISASGPAAVGAHAGTGPFGAYDTVGNVREWVWNSDGDARWSLGGAWSDRPYMATLRHSLPPFDRSSLNGFRLVRYLDPDPPPQELTEPLPIGRIDHSDGEPVSDEVYASMVPQFAYSLAPLADSVEWIDESNRAYVRHRISVDAGYDGERTPIHLFLPKTGSPPYPTVLFFPGLASFTDAGHSDDGMLSFEGPEEFVWKSGMALAWPVYYRSFERSATPSGLSGSELRRYEINRLVRWRADVGRTLDYLETRDDIDIDRLMYLGFSFGASVALPILALEDRFRAAILVSGGVGGTAQNPDVYSLNHLPRATLPVLMVNGEYDRIFPQDTRQEPLLARLGTPLEDKRYRVYEAGHWPLPRAEWIPEALAWTERYLGPID
jgi:dienelactone hydrolase